MKPVPSSGDPRTGVPWPCLLRPATLPITCRRRGAVLAAVLICLLVVGLVSVSLVKLIVLHQRQTDGQLEQLQAFWLAEAGTLAAARQLQQDASALDSGWTVDVPHPDGTTSGRVEARVVNDEPAGERQLVVTAYWPDEPIDRHREERIIPYPLVRGEN